MPSAAAKGAYYKAKTRRWLEATGYQVLDLEMVGQAWTPHGVIRWTARGLDGGGARNGDRVLGTHRGRGPDGADGTRQDGDLTMEDCRDCGRWACVQVDGVLVYCLSCWYQIRRTRVEEQL